MATVSLREAQADLADLLTRAEAGEEIVIERENLPAVRLSVTRRKEGNLRKRRHGSFARLPGPKGDFGYGSFAHLQGRIPDTFFDPLPEDELKLWEGGD